MTGNDVEIAIVYPDLLGTYGDGGNARILARRLAWRGIGSSVVSVALGTTLPTSCDIYLLGGGEDSPQALAAAELRASGALGAAINRGAAVLAVCAGLQILGTRFRTADGVREGVGVIDADSAEPLASRAVGEVVVDAGVTLLSGYENHASATTLGAGVAPLGRVLAGWGNGDGADGVVGERLLGTYLHGPVLARNPELADRLLEWVVGALPALDPDVDADALHLRASRIDAALKDQRRLTTWRRSRPGPSPRSPRR